MKASAITCVVVACTFITGKSIGAQELRRAAQPPAPNCTKSAAVVRMQSKEAARAAGLQFARVTEQEVTPTIMRNAEIVYNANQYARLGPRAAGVIAHVRRDLGDSVAAGDVLAVIESSEVGSAKLDLHQAAATALLWKRSAERERSLADQGIGTEAEALEAEHKLVEAQIALTRSKQRLRNLGFSDADIEKLEASQDTSPRLELVAPLDGIVVERAAVQGEFVEPAKVLFAIANTRTMWAMIDLFEPDALAVATGQEVELVIDSMPDKLFTGTITWISSQISPETRTLKARAQISNPDGLLRAHSFGQVRITLRRSARSLIVPKDAIQWDGCCNLVFVKTNDEATAFQAKKVHLGLETGGVFEVLSGLAAGEEVVTTGSYLLKTEILKGSIGAGCCDHAVEKLTK